MLKMTVLFIFLLKRAYSSINELFNPLLELFATSITLGMQLRKFGIKLEDVRPTQGLLECLILVTPGTDTSAKLENEILTLHIALTFP